MLSSYPEFVGCRHIPDLEEQSDWLARDDVIKGIRAVTSEKGKAFDLLLRLNE